MQDTGLNKTNDVRLNWLKENKKSGLYDIKWSMIDKKKYIPMTVANMFAIRSFLYPLTLVRTRLQVQTSGELYKGTFHALRTITRYEGFSALYKGFWVNSFQAFPHVLYITSYEKIRQQVSLFTKNVYLIAFAGGGGSSIVAQSMSVPIDVLSQHMQLVGQKGANPSASSTSTSNPSSLVNNTKFSPLERIQVPEHLNKASNYKIVKYLSKLIYKHEGVKGFYRGYVLSTFLVSFNSSLWWPFYYFYQSKFRLLLPDQLPTIVIQCLCGPVSSLSANIITNPLDVMRTRMQLTKEKTSANQILKTLWMEERWNLFVKGLTARLSYSCFYSFFIILGYETVKKASLKNEYI